MVALGLLEAVLVSFVPAAAIVVLLAAAALLLSSCVFGEWRSAWRAAGLALGSTLVAALICLPWLIGVLSPPAGEPWSSSACPSPASGAASWGSLLRFAVGPIGVSPLAWGFVVAALVPLLLARGQRFRWAGRCWSIALVFWAVAWVIGRGWTGHPGHRSTGPAGPGRGGRRRRHRTGVAAFEEDLRAADFGWRQLIIVVATGAVVLGSVPTLVSAVPGRWDLPVNDFSQSVTVDGGQDGRPAPSGSSGWGTPDPSTRDRGARAPGLAYATSEDGSPDARWLWNAADPGPASRLASAVNLAQVGSHRPARDACWPRPGSATWCC